MEKGDVEGSISRFYTKGKKQHKWLEEDCKSKYFSKLCQKPMT
jgi:hypothetical protein